MWTLGLAAEVAFAQGITKRLVSDETIRQALGRLGFGWKRAKTGSPAPTRPTCAKEADARLVHLMGSHPDWLVGFQDEAWWSRQARPEVYARAAARQGLAVDIGAEAADTAHEALAYHGLLRADTGTMLRFVQGQPVSGV